MTGSTIYHVAIEFFPVTDRKQPDEIVEELTDFGEVDVDEGRLMTASRACVAESPAQAFQRVSALLEATLACSAVGSIDIMAGTITNNDTREIVEI
ncbi:hypothetical protein [Halosegnis longus]|uniref:hypothetical protein n=1 Tax=Halosegnis longus TaxID=2216012 RepID=UPI0015629FD9|nr:hypothetical protein [Halosegnis longus]